jgi:chemotaxis protein MotB
VFLKKYTDLEARNKTQDLLNTCTVKLNSCLEAGLTATVAGLKTTTKR